MREILLVAGIGLAPLVALAACLAAARTLPRALARPWVLLAGSALVGGVGPVYLLATDGSSTTELYALFNVASVSLFAIGLGWILHLRDRQRFFEIALDAGLIIGAAIVVTLRWSPALRLAADSSTRPITSGIAVFGAPIAAGCALLFATVLLLVRGKTSAGAVAVFFGVAALGLAGAITPLAFGYGACCSGGDVASTAFVAGWMGVAAAGLYAARRGSRAFRSAGKDAGGSRLRNLVAPAVAIVMGAIAVDSAWNGQLRPPTAIAVAALGMLLALRVTQLLFATRTLTAERMELHQSNALIELSHALSGTTDLQETLDLVTRWAVRLLDGRAAGLELLTPEGDMLEMRAIHGLPDDLLRVRFPLDSSFTGWVVKQGTARSTADPRTDPFISAISLQFIGNSPIASAPLQYRGETLGTLTCIGHYPFDDTELELLGALADQAAVAIENARLFQEVHRLSMTDPLTGLPNRRQLEKDLHREFAAARRGRRLIIVMFDLNGFKEYNDRYGHLAGDDALRTFASALASETRTMNMAARYGGDEFIAVLADAARPGAQVFIDRVRQRFPGPDANERDKQLGVAAGIAEFAPDMVSPEELVAAADAALYREKTQRRAAKPLMGQSAGD